MAKIRKSVEVAAPVHRAFQLWSNVENFPGFMENVQSVERTGARTTHWKVEGPLGRFVEWDAETTAVEENRRIAWQSTGPVGTSGDVSFAPLASDRTRVDVELEYHTPGGAAGELLAKIFEQPGRKVEADLERFKDLAEGRAGR